MEKVTAWRYFLGAKNCSDSLKMLPTFHKSRRLLSLNPIKLTLFLLSMNKHVRLYPCPFHYCRRVNMLGYTPVRFTTAVE